jgi:hypothetical protein
MGKMEKLLVKGIKRTEMKRFDPIGRPYSKAMIIDDLGNYVLYSDYKKLEAERKGLTLEELQLIAKKVIKLADNMIETFEQMAEDKCWEMAIIAALSDNQFKTKELLLPSVNVALPKCTNCGKLMQLAAFECSCGIVKEA